jgi:hypothetical protein
MIAATVPIIENGGNQPFFSFCARRPRFMLAKRWEYTPSILVWSE